MNHGAFTRKKALDVASAVGSKLIGGSVSFAASAMTRHDEPWVDNCADKRDAFVGELGAAFVWMESELKLIAEIIADDFDITHELGFLGERHNNIKIVNVASIVHVAEVESDEAVELIEENIGEKLTGKVANNDTVAGLAVEEAFVGREGGPVFAGATNDDVAHRVVINNLMPEKFSGLVELIAIARAAGDLVFGKVIGWEGVRVDTTFELAI